jgi:hypothetical protein
MLTLLLVATGSAALAGDEVGGPADAARSPAVPGRPAGLASAAYRATTSAEWVYFAAGYFAQQQIDGSMRVGDLGESISVPPDFFFDNWESGAAVYFHALKNDKVGLVFDLNYVKTSGLSRLSDTESLDWRFELFRTELLGLYRFLWQERRSIDGLAGLRYKRIKLEGQVVGGSEPETSVGADWGEPVVGVRWLEDIIPGLVLGLRADVGGFGLGSNLTWQVRPGIGLATFGLALLFEYQYMDIDYDEGEGSEAFAYDAVEHGPMLGFGFLF